MRKLLRWPFFQLALLYKLISLPFKHLISLFAFTFFKLSENNSVIQIDINRWKKELYLKKENNYSLLYHLLNYHPEFRNLFYYRLESYSILIRWYYKPLESLHINTPKVGPGLFIQHGFATILAAQEIGSNCWINQQVTVGYSNKTDCPIIKDNVTIHAGVKIIGNVIINENSKIGANAVVIKDIPKNSTAVGVPANKIFPSS